jgi:hypothetical protein
VHFDGAPIGVMQMVDQDEEDDKIIAVHEHDPAFSHYRDISELPQHTLYELQQFFEDYKKLEHKKVRIERRLGWEQAHRIIEKSFQLYDASFDPSGGKRPDAPLLESEIKREEGNTRTPSKRTLADAARRAAARNQALEEEGSLFAAYGQPITDANGAQPPNSHASIANSHKQTPDGAPLNDGAVPTDAALFTNGTPPGESVPPAGIADMIEGNEGECPPPDSS